MSVHQININDILTDRSCFSSESVLYDGRSDEQFFVRSCERLGIVAPVILFSAGDDMFHLVDGFKRVRYAQLRGLNLIPATVLPESTPAPEIIALILLNKRSVIEASVINKIRFVRFALRSGAAESWVIEVICPFFGLKPDSSFLTECERVERLPNELQRFSHEKRFSLKQLVNLACYPMDILQQLAKWSTDLQLTASVMDEIASGLREYLMVRNLPLQEFLADDGVSSVLLSSLSPRLKTEKLRQLLYAGRFPVLSQANARIQEFVDTLELPGSVAVDWDRTLENRRVEVSLQLSDRKQWHGILKRLGEDDLAHTLGKILDEL